MSGSRPSIRELLSGIVDELNSAIAGIQREYRSWYDDQPAGLQYLVRIVKWGAGGSLFVVLSSEVVPIISDVLTTVQSSGPIVPKIGLSNTAVVLLVAGVLLSQSVFLIRRFNALAAEVRAMSESGSVATDGGSVNDSLPLYLFMASGAFLAAGFADIFFPKYVVPAGAFGAYIAYDWATSNWDNT